MSIETATFREELEKLDDLHGEIGKKRDDLADLILSEEFLTDRLEFAKKLDLFQSKIVAFAGYEEFLHPRFMSMLQQLGQREAVPPGAQQEEKKEESSRMFWAKAILVVIGLGFSYAAVYLGWIPQEIFIYFIGATVILALIPAALRAVQKFIESRHEPEETKPFETHLEDWINDQLERMRKKYRSAYLLIKAQPQGEKKRLKIQGVDKELYLRKYNLSIKLGDQFVSTINRLVEQCDRTIWSRRMTIAYAIVESKQGATRAAMQMRGTGAA